MLGDDVEHRAAVHAALADPTRLRIVELLLSGDHGPGELASRLGLSTNLLSHHLDTLEHAGIAIRGRSSADGRRRYVRLQTSALSSIAPRPTAISGAATFVCTRNSARSQLAEAVWRRRVGGPTASAGTHPAERVHPGAIAAADRAGLDLAGAIPKQLVGRPDGVVITVCDRAREELVPDDDWFHWSIAPPAEVGTDEAFDGVIAEIHQRIDRLEIAS